MTTICYNHNNNNNNWVHFNSHDNQCFEDEEEEALSLCDLPITSNDNNSHQEFETVSKNIENDQQDFEFGPCLVGNTAIRSQDNMCNADEVFFQGQLLPLRHSVSYEKIEEEEKLTRKINRSMSDPRTMIRSNNGGGYKPRVRNLFHSHPSPSPQIRSRTLSHSSNPKSSSSSLWSFLQVGLVKPQEIGLSDLKNRSKRFGSHNSNSSSNSSGTSTDQSQNYRTGRNPKSRINNSNNPSKNTKKKQRLFFGGCKCSADSIERTIKEQVPKMKKTTKDQENIMQPTATLLQDQAGKQTASRHRTFEWLKQLSLAAAPSPQSET